MSYSKLIHEYLDSQLNAVNEDVLFAELAKNSDLRIEFNQQVQLQNVAMSDMRTISPPAESTNVIFTSLGFTIPSGEYLRRIAPNPESGISMRPPGSALSRFVRKHVSTVAAVIITASLTTAVFMLTNNRFATPIANDNIAKANNEIPVISSQEKADIVSVKQSNLTNKDHSYRNNITGNAAQQVISENSTNMASLLGIAPSVKTDNRNETINLIGANGNSSSNFINNNITDPFFSALNIEPVQNFNDGNLAVIVSYSDQASNVSVNAPGQSFAANNLNATVLIKLNDNWYIGPTLGWEQFALNFTRNFDGEGYQFQKQPSLSYFGLTGKFAFPLKDYFEYGDLITPYAQVFGGTTYAGGFLGKAQFGITLTPYNKWAINIGYELANYTYKVENIENIFKNGLVLGAGLSF